MYYLHSSGIRGLQQKRLRSNYEFIKIKEIPYTIKMTLSKQIQEHVQDQEQKQA
jgi:hypothetical protein